MKKTFLLKGLDCPNCAAKIEKAVAALDGVEEARINLIKQTLSLTISDGYALELAKKIEAAVHTYERDVRVSELSHGHSHTDTHSEDHGGCHCHGHCHEHEHSHEHEHKHAHGHVHSEDSQWLIVRLFSGAFIYICEIICGLFVGIPLPVTLAVTVIAYLILGYDVLLNAIRNIVRGHVLDENFLMGISTAGAFAIGEYREAVAVMLFYQVGEFFQRLAVRRSRRSITELMDIRPDHATVIRDGAESVVPSGSIGIGELVLIKPGQRVPLDGIITDGHSSVDMRALTGESLPKDVSIGDVLLSGAVNRGGVLTVKVTKGFGESTASRIIELVENASAKKARTEDFITAFARYYTPAVVIFALLLGFFPPIILSGGWFEWIHRAMVFLVISCPCALVISIPLAFYCGIGAASRHGILVKGGNYLEALAKLDTVVFDKTGTLTKGSFSVTEITPSDGYSDAGLLELAAFGEVFSTHPIAVSILSAYGKIPDKGRLSNCTDIPGKGCSALLDGCPLLVGSRGLLTDSGLSVPAEKEAGTSVHVAHGGKYAGHILISDSLKPDSASAIANLRRLGVTRTAILTGDSKAIAERIATELSVDEVRAELLPDQKLEVLEAIEKKKSPKGKLAFVGDGINDAPVLARADVGIAMGALGSDAAIEAADVVLMTDELSKLPSAVRLARYTHSIVIQNIVLSLTVKGAFLILGAFGIAGMWEAVFGDVGIALIAVLNSMRVLKK